MEKDQRMKNELSERLKKNGIGKMFNVSILYYLYNTRYGIIGR